MDTKLQNALKEANSEVGKSGIVDPELKKIAFSKAIDFYLSKESESSQMETLTPDPTIAKKEIRSFQKESKKVKRLRPSISPAKLVDELIKNKFFNEKRKDTECMKELDLTKGVKIPRNQMATVLVRKLRSGSLKREKTGEGYVYFVG